MASRRWWAKQFYREAVKAATAICRRHYAMAKMLDQPIPDTVDELVEDLWRAHKNFDQEKSQYTTWAGRVAYLRLIDRVRIGPYGYRASPNTRCRTKGILPPVTSDEPTHKSYGSALISLVKIHYCESVPLWKLGEIMKYCQHNALSISGFVGKCYREPGTERLVGLDRIPRPKELYRSFAHLRELIAIEQEKTHEVTTTTTPDAVSVR